MKQKAHNTQKMSDTTSEGYELLEVPGLDNIRIAVLPSMFKNDMEEVSETRFYEWFVSIDFIFLPRLGIQLHGWYAESERETGTDVGNQLFTSASIKHSELILVLPNGPHLATLDNFLATGEKISDIIITHFSKMHGIAVPIQVNTFGGCYVTHVQQVHDYIVARARISSKTVVCTSFSQKGIVRGLGICSVDFRDSDVF